MSTRTRVARAAKLCPLVNPKTGQLYNKTSSELIVMATMSLAIQGNAKALREVWERLDGKVPKPLADVDAEWQQHAEPPV